MESIYMRCNLCGANKYETVTETSRTVQTSEDTYVFNLRVVCCKKCGLVYLNPRKTSEELTGYYESVYRAPIHLDNLDEERRSLIQTRTQLLKEHIQERRGKLLEIGCGEGFFLQKVIREGFDATGIEPSVEYSKVCYRIAPQANIFTKSFEEFETKDRFDIICSFFVLEHVIDATTFLNKCHEFLNQDGILYLEIPDVELYPKQLSDMIWHEHIYHFSRTTIQRFLMKTGFEAIDIYSPGPSYQFGIAVFAKKISEKDTKCRTYLPDSPAHNLAFESLRRHLEVLNYYRFRLKTELDSVLKRVRSGHRKMAIYGSGIFHDNLHTYTNLMPEDVTLVIDDNQNKWGRHTHQGLEIQSPARLAESGANLVLIASDCFEAKMVENVMRLSSEHRKSYEPISLHTKAKESMGFNVH